MRVILVVKGGSDAQGSPRTLQKAVSGKAASVDRRGWAYRVVRKGSGRRLDQGPRRPGEHGLHEGVLLRAGERRPPTSARCRVGAPETGRRCVWLLRALQRTDLREATRGASVRPPLHRLPAGHRGGGTDGHGLAVHGPVAPSP